MRESDAVIGMVSLKLGEVLKNSGRSTAWYTLTGGVGHGKIKLSVLFRSCRVQIPAPLRGYGIGVVEVQNVSALLLNDHKASAKTLHAIFETVGGKKSLDAVAPQPSSEGVRYTWPLSEPLRIAVRQRYPSLLYIDLGVERSLPGKRARVGHAVVGLNRISDLQPSKLKIPIFEGEDEDAVEQALYRAMSFADELIDESNHGDDSKELPILEELCATANRELPKGTLKNSGVTRVGTLEISLIFFPGVAPEHKPLVAGDGEMRVAWDTYLTAVDAGERPRPKDLSALQRSLQSQPQLDTANLAPKEGGADKDELYNPDTPIRIANALKESEGNPEDEDDSLDEDILKRRRIRQQQGAAQIKGYRTARWIKEGMEDGLHKLKHLRTEERKRPSGFEKEGVSHF